MILAEVKTVDKFLIPPLTACGPMPSLELAKSTFSAGIDRDLQSLIENVFSGKSFDLDYCLHKKLVFLPAESRLRAAVNLGKTDISQEIAIREIQRYREAEILRPKDFYTIGQNISPLDISLSLRRIIYFVRAYPDLFAVKEIISLFPFFGLPDIAVIKICKKNNGLYAAMYREDEGIPMPIAANVSHRFFLVKSLFR